MSIRGGLTVFMHIPKTGGTTLCNILSRKYKNSVRIRSVHTIVPDSIKYKAQLPEPFLLEGHLNYDEVKDISGNFVFTFLRSPVSRVISHYYFLKEIPSNEFNEYLNRADTTIESFYAQKTKRDIDNCLVRYLSGRHKDFGTIDEQDYLLALHNLEHKINFFGLQEYYDESLIMLGKKLGWNLPVYRKKNQTNKKDLVSEETLQFLKKANKWDIMLYEQAKVIFMQKMNEMSAAEKKKLAQLKFFNKILSLVTFSIPKLPF